MPKNNAIMNTLPVSELHLRFRCDFDRGLLFYREGQSFGRAGKLAGHHHKDGYINVNIRRKSYPAHRIIWAMYFGVWPELSLDHKDCDKTNNAIGNLREASPSQNCANKRKKHGGSSRLKGVVWHKALCKWQAQIGGAGKRYYLGVFDTEQDAHNAYVRKAQELFGNFSRAA